MNAVIEFIPANRRGGGGTDGLRPLPSPWLGPPPLLTLLMRQLGRRGQGHVLYCIVLRMVGGGYCLFTLRL